MKIPLVFLVDPISKEEISPEDFAEFVINMRHSIGLTRRDFALAMGVNRGTVVFWERGNIIPSNFASILNTIRIVVKVRIRNKRLIA
ncbi:helix-turn-helix domain-containing protein [Metabacillus halosaccharovorans]|uniref:helix-turn-helix domain-containing protein n=1 Tax=Metabacillus halosaccharovorans TaxID=930124 RepID=UPI0034CFCB7F